MGQRELTVPMRVRALCRSLAQPELSVVEIAMIYGKLCVAEGVSHAQSDGEGHE